MKAVITIVGEDRVGIIFAVTKILAENNVNVLQINQNIVDGFFNMVMIVDPSKSIASLKALQLKMQQTGEAMGLEIKMQHEDIFRSMHRI